MGPTSKEKERFFAKVGPPVIVQSGYTCRLWQAGKDRDGYGMFWIDGKTKRANRVALMIEKGDDFNPDLQVNHHCPNQPDCVNPECLYQGTQRQNVLDAIWDGTHVDNRGSKNRQSKLTEDDIPVIRQRYADGETQQSIANDYAVGRRTIGRIIKGDTWKHTA